MSSDPDTSVPSGLPERGDSAQMKPRVADTKGESISTGNLSGTGIAIGSNAQSSVVINHFVLGNSSQEPMVDLASLVKDFPVPLSPLHETYVEREQTKDLISRLTDTKSKRPTRIVLHGFGGRGKTSLINQIANMQSIKDHFSGLILWLEADELMLEKGRLLVNTLSSQTRTSLGSSPSPHEMQGYCT